MGYIVEGDNGFTAEFRRESVILYHLRQGDMFCEHGGTDIVEVERGWLKELLGFFHDPEHLRLLHEPYSKIR